MYFNSIQNHIFQWNSKLIWFNKPLLTLEVENGIIEIVKLLLLNDKLNFTGKVIDGPIYVNLPCEMLDVPFEFDIKK